VTDVGFQRWTPHLWALTLISAAIIGILSGSVATTFVFSGPSYEYHLWRWEANTIIGNLFDRLGIGPDPNDTVGEDALRHYFGLTSRIRAALDTDNPDADLVDALTGERAAYANDVERLIERYIDEAVASRGLQRQLPLFNGVALTWPPVDFNLTSPPQLLVRSPRDRIERKGDTLLKAGLTLHQIEDIEDEADSASTVSIVVAIGGLAAYPAIVRDDRSYDSLLDTASHEWVHHYLAFYPLGEQWGEGGDAEALNETTANIAGREIANLIRAAHPVQLPQGADGTAPPGPEPTVDYSVEMRRLRLEVDALLAEGKVDEAERTMEDRRRYLAEHGIPIRKLNQAYFAFYGTYADTPASSNPIGPKIERVWELTRDVGPFLTLMRDVRTAGDLDTMLTKLERASGQAR